MAFDIARERLIAFQQHDEDGNMELSELTLATNVSLESFVKYREKTKPSVQMRLVDGKIRVYEVPFHTHGVTVGNLAVMAALWSNQLNVITELDIVVGLNTTMCVADLP